MYCCVGRVSVLAGLFKVPEYFTFFAVIGNDLIPFFGAGSRHKCDHGIGVAHIEDFVRHALFDVDEVAGFVFKYFFELMAKFVTDPAFKMYSITSNPS